MGLLIAGPLRLRCEEMPFDGAHEASVVQETSKQQPAQEVIFGGLVSYGNYKIFAGGTDCKLYTAGVEYDRHSWGYMLKARVDYVGEILPVVLLWEPDKADIWGNPMSTSHHIVPGLGISPIGARWIWRDGKAVKPYLLAKGGMLFLYGKGHLHASDLPEFQPAVVDGSSDQAESARRSAPWPFWRFPFLERRLLFP